MLQSDSTEVRDITSRLVCEDCFVEIKQGEIYFWEDGKVRCPKCYEVYLKLKRSRQTEATKLEGYL